MCTLEILLLQEPKIITVLTWKHYREQGHIPNYSTGHPFKLNAGFVEIENEVMCY